jgi:hypothetical protein
MVLGAGLTLRILVTIAYRPALLFQSDAYVYLQKAADLEPSHYRPILYSLFLKPFVMLHSVLAAVILQHILALGLVVLLYVFLQRKGVPPIYACLGVTPLALDAYQLDIEHYVLAEVLFQVAATCALIVLTWKTKPGTATCLVAGGLLGLSGTTRFLGVALILPAIVYVWRRSDWRRAISMVAATAVPLILYALWFASHLGTFALSDRDGHFLYGRVSVFADCDDLDVPEYQKALCDPRPIPQRENPNFYVFNGGPPDGRVDPPDGMTRNEMLNDYATSVILQQPARYAKTVLPGMLHYFSPTRSTGSHDNRLEHWRFPLSTDHAEPQAYLVRTNEGSPPPKIDEARFTVNGAVARLLRWYQRWAYTHGPLLALALVAVVIGVSRSRRKGRPIAEAILLATSGLILMMFPVATVTFDYRFMLLALPVIPPAAVLAYAERSTATPSGEMGEA